MDARARRRGLIISIVEGMSAQAQTACTGNGAGGPIALTVGFAFLLGADNPALGLLAALPVFGNVLHYLAAFLAPRLRTRKTVTVLASTLSRVAWLGIGAIPFVVADRDRALALFLVAWGFTNALMSLSGNLWVSWMADLVPPRIRGRYFARRTLFTMLVQIVVPLLVSTLLDRRFGGVPRKGEVADAALATLRAQGFALVFGIAAGFGLLCGLLLWLQPEPPRGAPAGPGAPPASEPPRAGAFLEPFRDARFRKLLLFVAAFGFTNGISNPFWHAFQLEQLLLPYAFVNGWSVAIQGTAMVLALLFWGRVSDRLGNRPVLVLTLCLIVTHPIYYVFASSPDRWFLMLFDATSSGVAWAGYNMALFNLVLALAPPGRREVYVATNAVVIGACQAVSSLLAGKVAAALPGALPFNGLVLHPRQQIFLATSVARVACLAYFLLRVEEPRSRPMRAVVVAAQAYVKARLEIMKLLPEREDRP